MPILNCYRIREKIYRFLGFIPQTGSLQIGGKVPTPQWNLPADP
ncbi:hypothetical protein DYBT9275_00551 [Dyadobacter sp. CECT 9275]|uniref:Uncharacterized protein n=1 Tax=Dyadobacter helix TaxID=2822344 RepID=A0A916JAB0_9BACT|nr:hypothetical protein DYBT9275_00551 [Dyadobacter sp. CECT 9275]